MASQFREILFLILFFSVYGEVSDYLLKIFNTIHRSTDKSQWSSLLLISEAASSIPWAPPNRQTHNEYDVIKQSYRATSGVSRFYSRPLHAAHDILP